MNQALFIPRAFATMGTASVLAMPFALLIALIDLWNTIIAPIGVFAAFLLGDIAVTAIRAVPSPLIGVVAFAAVWRPAVESYRRRHVRQWSTTFDKLSSDPHSLVSALLVRDVRALVARRLIE